MQRGYTMKKITQILALSVLLTPWAAFSNENINAEEPADEQKEIMHVPAVFSFVGNEFLYATGKDIETNFAFGMLGNSVYVINGFQASSLYNITHEAYGFQGSGIFNINTDDFSGFQGSGIFNINGGNFTGLQTSGIFNINAGYYSGLQSSGIFNINAKDVKGAQLAGIFNIGAGSFTGFQGAGILNISSGETATGVQSAGIVNIRRGSLKGVQIGLINICSDDCTFQLGLINISKNGIMEVGASFTSNKNIRLSFTSGNQYLYTVVGLQCKSSFFTNGFTSHWFCDNFSSFAGLGTRQKYSIFNADLEVLCNSRFGCKSDRDNSGSYLSGRISAGITPVKNITFFAGYNAAFEHESLLNSRKAFRNQKSNMKTSFDSGLTIHHEIDAGVKLILR